MQGRPSDYIRESPFGRSSKGCLRVPALVLVGVRSGVADQGLQIALEVEGSDGKP